MYCPCVAYSDRVAFASVEINKIFLDPTVCVTGRHVTSRDQGSLSSTKREAKEREPGIEVETMK